MTEILGAFTLALQAAALCYGLLWFAIFVALAIVRTYITRRPSRRFWTSLEHERRRLWDLSVSPHDLSHAFHVRADGTKIHYMTNSSHSRRNLVIFIHGWPDNNNLWHYTMSKLKTMHLPDTAFVALDLPGHGGSDGLSSYGTNQVMETIFEFITSMREKYFGAVGTNMPKSGGKCIIVGHDWGAICAYRLAAETPVLADRFIMLNAGPVPLFQENLRRRWLFTRRMIGTWVHRPSSLGLLRSAAITLYPVLFQLRCSYYVFIMNLPRPLVEIYGSSFQFFNLRVIQSVSLGYSSERDDGFVATRVAASIGPDSIAAESKTVAGESYGASTRERAAHGNFFESIRLYREGLATGKWEKSLQTLAAVQELDGQRRKSLTGAGILEEGPKGALKAPSTVLWGSLDRALDSRLLISGFADYLAQESQLVVLPTIGHWIPIDSEGPSILAETIVWAVTGGFDDIGSRIRRVYPAVKVQVSKERPIKMGQKAP